MKPLAIIGLDPGTTSAYVVLDLQRNILKTGSGKEFTLARMISEIMEVSTPLFVSTDKAKVPSLIEEFSRKVGAEIVSPEEDLQKEEKRQSVNELQIEKASLNDHQKDCLAAALFSHKRLALRLAKINHYITLHNLHERRDEFTKIALQKDYHFALIKDILATPPEEKKILTTVFLEKRVTEKDFVTLYEKISQEKEKNASLQKTIFSLQDRIKSLRKVNEWLRKRVNTVDRRIEALFSFKEERLKGQQQELGKKEQSISSLQGEVKGLQAFISRVPQCLLVKKLDTLSYDEFLAKKEILNITGNDVIFVRQPTIYSDKVLKELKGKGIILVSQQKMPLPLSTQFQTGTISPGEFFLQEKMFALIEKEELEKRIATKDFIEKIVEEYKESRKQE